MPHFYPLCELCTNQKQTIGAKSYYKSINYQQAQPFFFVFAVSSAALFACLVSLVLDLAFFFLSASSRFECQ